MSDILRLLVTRQNERIFIHAHAGHEFVNMGLLAADAAVLGESLKTLATARSGEVSVPVTNGGLHLGRKAYECRTAGGIVEDRKRADEFAEKGTLKWFLLSRGFFPNNEEDAAAILDSLIAENGRLSKP